MAITLLLTMFCMEFMGCGSASMPVLWLILPAMILHDLLHLRAAQAEANAKREAGREPQRQRQALAEFRDKIKSALAESGASLVVVDFTSPGGSECESGSSGDGESGNGKSAAYGSKELPPWMMN